MGKGPPVGVPSHVSVVVRGLGLGLSDFKARVLPINIVAVTE